MIEVKDDTALIRAAKTGACEKCVSKKVCKGITDTEMLIEALNPVGASVGDEVIFTVGASTVLKAGVTMYLLPLLAFIAGVVAGQVAGGSILPGWDADLLSAVLGFAFLVFTYAGLYACSRITERKRSYMPTIIRVV